MDIKTFVENYKAKRFMNTKQGVDEKTEWIRSQLGIKEYIPFRQKREIAEMVIEQNIEMVDGVKKHDEINSYLCFMVAVIAAHTALQFSDDPVADYDMLAESGLLPIIVAEFQQDYAECDVILKMALAMELQDNNVNVLVGHFLDSILKKLDGVGEVMKDVLGDFDLKDVLGADISKEDLAKLSGLINKIK